MEIKANVSSVLVGRVLALLVILIGFIAAIWAGVEAQRDRFWIFLQMKKTLLLAILPMVLVLAVGYVGGPTAVSAQEVNPPTAEIEVGGPTGRSVDVGERFLLSFTLGELSGSGDHGGITISFPSLTDPDESSAQHVYSSSQAHVDVSLYSGDRSNVHFREVGDTIYSASGRTMPAEHLLVEFDEPSWTESSSITIVLRVTPKQNGRFDVRYRQWVCSDGYDNCSRADRSATVLDQQGWRAHAMTVDVTEPPADDSGGAQEDDHGDSRGGSTVIREGSTTAGDIERSGDWDYFRFRAERGREYTIEIRTDSDTEIELYDGDGDSIDSDDDGGQGYGSRLVWRAPSSGDYYVAVRGYANEVTGSYTLSVTGEEPTDDSGGAQEDDHGDSRGGSTVTREGSTTAGDIERSGDWDYFRFRAEGGREYTIETRTDSDTEIELYDGDGDSIDSDDDGGEGYGSRLVWRAPSSGDYYVAVRGYANEVTGSYTLSVTREEPTDDSGGAQEDDHGDSRGGSTVIREGSTTAGDIERSGDWDYFRFRAEGGREYTIETRTESDTEIELYDGDGDSIDSDDDGGEGYGSRLVWRAPSSGDYYVAVRGYANEVTGSYTLSVTREEPAEPSRQPDLAISDIRWSPSSPSAGAQLTFHYTVHNLGTGDSGEFGNELVIDNAAIDISARSSLAARSSRDRSFTFLWTCPAGTHSVRVRADEANEVAETNENNNDGLESLTCAAEAQEDDHGDSRGASTVIREGSTTAGDIERSGDWDYFRFRAEGGREYTIETRTDSDTEIELYDGDGDSIDSDDDGGEGYGSRLVWRAPSSGDYYVAVRGYANEVTGSYTLSVTGEEPAAPILTGWEDDFWEVLIDAPASDFAHTGYMTTDTRVKVSMGPVLGDGGLRELAIDIVHEDGIDGHGHVNLLLPQGAWVSYDHIRKWIRVPTDRDSEDWQWVYYHPRQERAALGINEGLLTLVGMIPVIGPLMATAEYLEFAFPDEQRRPEAVEFYGNYRNCYRSVTVPWFVAGYPAGVKVVIPVIVATDEFVALASEFTARRLERGATARQREVTFELGSIEVTDLLGAGQPTSCGPR